MKESFLVVRKSFSCYINPVAIFLYLIQQKSTPKWEWIFVEPGIKTILKDFDQRKQRSNPPAHSLQDRIVWFRISMKTVS